MSEQAHDPPVLKDEIRRLFAGVVDDPQDVESLSDGADLSESGLINSVKFVKLVNQLESEFGIRFKIEDISAGNFSSINSISEIVGNYKERKGV